MSESPAASVLVVDDDTGVRTLSRVILELEGFVVRDLGSFLLRGRKTPERIFELINAQALATSADLDLATRFSAALQNLHAADKAAALAAFQAIRALYPADGATAFYLEQLQNGGPPPGNVLALD